MASGIYNRFKANLMNGEADLSADGIRIALYNASHAFTATHTDYTTTNELATSGNYTQGGVALANMTVHEAATTYWDADDVAWTSATFSAYHGVLYNLSITNDLIASIDFGGVQTVSSGTFTVQWNASLGVITLA